MTNCKRGLFAGALGAILLGAPLAAQAQTNSQSEAVIGPPALRDFSLEPSGQIVPPPDAARQPAQQPPLVRVPAPSPPAEQARATVEQRAPVREPEAARPAPSRTDEERPSRVESAEPAAPNAFSPAGTGAFVAAPAPLPAPAAEPAAPVSDPGAGTSYWLFALPAAAALAFFGIVAVRRRRRPAIAAAADPMPAAAPPPPRPPRADPVPRPWLEISLKAERATFTDEEAEIQFELEISNKSATAVRDLRIDVKMINAGAEQDKEIGAFFRTAGREATKLRLPGVEPGVTGLIRGSVGMKREDMRAMRLDEKLIFIPVVAVNALYDWGEGRTGQTSKSYVVGRELQQPSEKMGPFRVDQGPRIWRTVGQRPHKLARRV